MAAPVLDALRPKPFRGDVLAAGVVVLTTLVFLLHLRFDKTWGAGIHLVYAAAAFAVVLAMAVQSPVEGASPRPYQSVLYLTSLALALFTLIDLADVLGADDPPNSSGTAVWVLTAVAGLAVWFAVTRNSAVCTLVAAVTGGIAVLAFVNWVFDPSGAGTFRWILLLLTGVFGLTAVAQRDRRPRHAVSLVDAAGVACAALGITLALSALLTLTFNGQTTPAPGAAWGWELVLLAVAYGLLAYASIEGEPGPGYLGALNLLLFVVIAAGPGRDDASLIGWPLFLIVAAGGLLAIALRPTTPAPPAPDAGAPPAPTSPLRSEGGTL